MILCKKVFPSETILVSLSVKIKTHLIWTWKLRNHFSCNIKVIVNKFLLHLHLLRFFMYNLSYPFSYICIKTDLLNAFRGLKSNQNLSLCSPKTNKQTNKQKLFSMYGNSSIHSYYFYSFFSWNKFLERILHDQCYFSLELNTRF